MSAEKTSPFAFFATCGAGAEVALRDELRDLGLYRVRADRGGARFVGDLEHGMKACLESRIASRILLSLGEVPASSSDTLYEGLRELPWERWLGPERTLAVSAVSREEALRHTGFVAQRTKDAIVDRIRDLEGARPSVERDDPDVAVFVHIARGEARVYLDVSGEALHRRGWRRDIGPAPLKETLAAAVLRLAGWDRHTPLHDPVCGSGTIAIEADLLAREVAPGLGRRFGIERWRVFDETRKRELGDLRAAARDRSRPRGPDVRGSDADPRAIRAARANAKRAGSELRLEVARVADLGHLGAGGLVVGNPPYGVRMGEDTFWDELAGVLHRLRGSRLVLILPEAPPSGLLPPPTTVHRLYNGQIECGLGVWDLA